MSENITIDLFAEDRAHEEFLKPLIARIAREEDAKALITVRSARGGHSKAIREYNLYQTLIDKRLSNAPYPDVVVVGIDGNCTTFSKKREEIRDSTREEFLHCLVAACPDPHVERWYLADPDSFHEVVGHRPVVGQQKCERDHYKLLLSTAVREGGVPSTLGGLEFAEELANKLDLPRAMRIDASLRAFVTDLRNTIRQIRSGDRAIGA